MGYRFIRKLGKGAFGEVFEAVDQSGQRYAVKVSSSDEVARRRLRSQFAYLARTHHQRIVSVYEFDALAPQGSMMVTELVTGEDLRSYVEAFGEQHLLEIVAKILDALRYLHSIGRIHGDIKPSSILITHKDGQLDVKLIDAGFETQSSSLSDLQGTPAYLAPEIIRNTRPDGRSDLYSLGMTLYEILSGSLPFDTSDINRILSYHLDVPPDLEAIEKRSPAWATFLRGLLEKEPSRRYSSAIHAGYELERLHSAPGIFSRNLLPAYAAQFVGADQIESLANDLIGGKVRFIVVDGTNLSGVSRTLRELTIHLLEHGYRVHHLLSRSSDSLLIQLLRIGSKDEALRSGAIPTGRHEIVASIFDHLMKLPKDGRKHIVAIDDADVREEEVTKIIEILDELPQNVQAVIGCHGFEHWKAKRLADYGAVFKLEPLDLKKTRTMIQSILGSVRVPEKLVEAIYNVGYGYPGTMDLILRYLLNSGHIGFSIDREDLTVEWDGSIKSPDIEEQLQHWLGTLSSDAQSVLFAIAVARGRIERTILEKIYGDESVSKATEELRNKGLVIEFERRSRIALIHGLMEDPLRRLCPPEVFSEVGRKIYELLERMPRSPWDNLRLGMLLWSLGKGEDALEYLIEAGRDLSSISPIDAMLAYETALECTSKETLKASIHEKIGDTALATNDLDMALQHFEIASPVLAPARRKLAWAKALKGATEEAIEILKACERDASSRDDLSELARIKADLGYVYVLGGEIEEALKALTRAAAIFSKLGLPGEEARAYNRMGVARMKAGNFKEALIAYRSATEAFRKAEDQRRAALAAVNEALCLRKDMKLAEASHLIRESIAILENERAPYERASCYQAHALVLLDLGELDQAEQAAKYALKINRSLGVATGVVSSTLMVAGVELERGNWHSAQKLITTVLKGKGLTAYQLAIATRYLARVRALQGKIDEATDLVEESLSYASVAKDTEGKGQALLEMANICLKSKRYGEAAETALQARAILALAPSPLYSFITQTLLGEVLALSDKPGDGLSELLIAKDVWEHFPKSLHLGRTYKALATVYCLIGDQASYWKYVLAAMEIFSTAGARYDFGVCLLDAGEVALSEAKFVRAGKYLREASHVFEGLGIDDLREKAVEMMEKVGSHDIESSAIASLSSISKILSSSRDLTSVLNSAMDLAVEYLGAERGVLLLIDEVTDELKPIVERRMDSESIKDALDISRTIVEEVRSTREPVISADATKDPRFTASKSIAMHNIKSVMSLPLKVDEELLGIIYLDSRSVPATFTDLEKAFVDAFANQVALAIANARYFGKLHDHCVDLRVRAGERYSFANIVGPGKRMQEIFRQVEKAAKSKITILITGESGTGKELIAGLIHELSPREEKPYVIVDLAAISKDLLETELFGIEKKVATGVAARPGVFERANGGTIFLDEIGDMPLETQMKVLRVLAEQQFTRVGGAKVIRVDVRVISATNKDLKGMMDKGLFRSDLYYRLNAMQIHLPPLRDRLEDLPALIAHFLRKYTAQNAKPSMEISSEALEVLKSYWWPGNVRELEKCIEHAVVVAEGRLIGIEHIPREIVDNVRIAGTTARVRKAGGATLPEAVQTLEKEMILDALRRTGNVKTRAAELLGIHESTLRKKLKAYHIEE